MQMLRRIAALLILLPMVALAQAPAGPIAPKPGTPVQQPPKDAVQIKVKVNLVSTPVTVRDARGNLVLSLDKPDFRVFDSGVEQRIEDFDLGGEPISAVVAMESSSRIEPLLPAVRKTGILITQTVMAETGEAALVTFDDDVRLEVPFTRSHDDIEKAMAGVKMGYSGTRLYDAMARGVSLLSERPANRRRVLLVLAEAADTGSEANLGEIIRDAQLNNITIYSVGLSTAAANLRKKPEQRGPAPIGPEGTFPVPGRNGSPQTPTSEQQERSRHADLIPLIIMIVKTAAHTVKDNSLEVATAATGGMHVATFKDESIEHALDEIGGELHAQYTLTYRPTGTDPYGFHEIKVQVAQRGMKARTRPGYYLGEKN